MSELLRIRAGDSDFSVTVGRSTAGFVYGTRSLPDDIDGIPAFVMDSTPLLVNQMEGRVEKDSSQVFTYGGSDGRDLLSRSEMIPKGQFSFTRSDLSVTRHEEDHEDGTTTRTITKDFDVAGTIRRVTGDVNVSVELGQDSLGTIIPGVDVNVGDHILLDVWEQTLELVVSSYRHSSTGWKMTVESVVQAPTLSKTNEMVQRWRTPSERIEQLSKEVRDFKANYESASAISSGGGEQGPPGRDGKDGFSPYIHPETGTWWVGPVDTYVQAQGPEGKQGPPGPPAEGSSGPPLLLTQKIDQNKVSTGSEILEYTGTASAAISTSEGNVDYHRYDFQFPYSLYGEYPNGLVTLNASYLGNSGNLGSLANLSFYLSSGRPRIHDYPGGSSLGDFEIGASSSTRNLYLFVEKSRVRENYGTTRIPEINVTFMPVTLPTG